MNSETTREEPRLWGSSSDKVASGVAATKLRGSSMPIERLQTRRAAARDNTRAEYVRLVNVDR